MACGLCHVEGPIAARNFGVDLCEACETGALRGRLGAWRARIEIDEVLIADASDKLLRMGLGGGLRSDATETDTAIVVKVEADGLQPLMATFVRRTLKARLLSFIQGGRLKTGDPLFDHTVIATSKTPQFLQQLLQNDGFQSAVLSLTAHCGQVEITPSGLEVAAPLADFDLRAEIPLAAASLLRHVAGAS